MASREESFAQAEIHFEGDSLEVLSGFPDEIKRTLGFAPAPTSTRLRTGMPDSPDELHRRRSL
ncbi:MAG: hypothetical protein ACRD3K_14280 [Edaphobacter sp.]